MYRLYEYDRKNNTNFIKVLLTYMECGCNGQKAAAALFIHRNTLVYRIEKLQKATGLDIRTFDDALTFKIAMMVVNYMKYLDTLDY